MNTRRELEQELESFRSAAKLSRDFILEAADCYVLLYLMLSNCFNPKLFQGI